MRLDEGLIFSKVPSSVTKQRHNRVSSVGIAISLLVTISKHFCIKSESDKLLALYSLTIEFN